MGVVVPQSEIVKGPLLNIEMIEGPDLPNLQPSFLEINACGMVGGKRGKSDGCVIIGSIGPKQAQSSIDDRGPLNDFDIAVDETGVGKRHMIIKYSLAEKRYFLRDLGEGSGTFVKISLPLLLKNGYIISFGDSHMTVNFYQDAAQLKSKHGQRFEKIQLKFIDGPKTDKTFEYTTE